jgi:hypothetical protein
VPDWRKLVAERRGVWHLTERQRREIAAELATHLEDVFEERRARGFSEREAINEALSEVSDWHELATKIAQAKRGEGVMSDRTRCFWLPGLASFNAAMIWEVALGAGPIGHGPMFHSHVTQLMYALRLMTLLFCGALGAFLSRRAGGTRSERAAAALFTSGILLCAILIVIGICAAARAAGLGFSALDMSMLVKPIFTVILIPSLAMLAGALPFLSKGKPRALA